MEPHTEPVAGVTAVAGSRISMLHCPTLTAASLASTRMPPNKRLLSAAPSKTDMQPHSKKRRKQSRPIRISTPTSEEIATHLNILQNDQPNETLQEERDFEETEEGELTSAYLSPKQLAELCAADKPTPASTDEANVSQDLSPDMQEVPTAFSNTYANNAVQSLLPTLLSFSPHFLLPILPSSGQLSQQASSSVAPPGATVNPPRIFNLEAYCELCSKEFCNKYFLKTHKANRHGIYVKSGDTPPSSTTPLPSSHIPTSNAELVNSVPSPTVIATSIKTTPIKLSTEHPRINCDLCFKKFHNEYALKRHIMKVHWRGSTEGPSIETGVTEDISGPSSSPVTSEKETTSTERVANDDETDEPHVVSMPTTSASPTLVPPEKLKRMGVINADAFCEICSKEYCNKYFLKTHKLKRHGIIVRDSDDAKTISDLKNEAGKSRVWEAGATGVQTSPLNLTVNEQATCSNSSDSGGVPMPRVEERADDEGVVASSFTEELDSPKEEPLSPQAEDSGLAADAARDLSEDLQKLQTMLLQLNALNGTSVACDVFASQQVGDSITTNDMELHKSAIEENGRQGTGASSPQASSSNPSSPAQLTEIKSEAIRSDDTAFSCNVCGHDVFSNAQLTQHMADVHGVVPKATEEGESTGDSAQLGTAANNMPFYSTSCYCDICNKELCNKYFKKVHMQKMHGIEIKDNALSGGVPCDICHKQLCSKYFVRVHKQNTHGIVDLSAPPTPTSSNSAASSPLNVAAAPVSLLPSPLPADPSFKQSEATDLTHRYYTHFNVVCPLCSRRFRSAKWLKAHLVNDHADVGLELARELEPKCGTKTASKGHSTATSEENEILGTGSNFQAPAAPPTTTSESANATTAMLTTLLRCKDERYGGNYHCSYCTFSTPVLSLLFVHERSHTGLPSGLPVPTTKSSFSCNLCFKSFGQAEMLSKHLRTHQLSGLQSVADEKSSEAEETKQSRLSYAQTTKESTKETRGITAGRFRCAHCHHRFRTRDNWAAHMQSHANHADKQDRNSGPPYCCSLCPFSSDVLTSFRKHVKNEHWHGADSPAQSRLWRTFAPQVDVSRTLQDAARETHVPATYAVPQALPEHGDRFIMQPFLLEEPPETVQASRSPGIETAKNDEPLQSPTSCPEDTDVGVTNSPADGTFVPSLVFLPVREKVSSTLTVSFTLTPA